MNTQELAQKTADLTDKSEAEVQTLIDNMDADQLINLTAAVQDEDSDSIDEILSLASEMAEDDDDAEPEGVQEIKAEIKSLGRKLMRDEQELTQLWPLIGKLDADDWRLVWPSLDSELMSQLYAEATDKEKSDISGSDATMLHDYAQSYIKESVVMYENTMWQVHIPQAPDNLVGIRNADHMILVPRRQLQSLQEHVMGMTEMPSLVRIKQLAGVPDAREKVSVIHVTGQLTGKPSCDTDWLQELRMHMAEIEKLQHEPVTPDTQEEIQLHVKALGRKAQKAAGNLKTTS
jgi:hypothetical protein